MEEINFAYLAGYIDGDGCFYIDTVKAKTGDYPVVHRTILKFASVDESIMKWLSEFLGINYWEKAVSKKRQHLNRRTVYEANVTGECLDKLLPRLFPYLRIKKQHCEIMLRMRKTYTIPKKGIIRPKLIPEQYNIRCECHKLLSSINTHKLLKPSAMSPSAFSLGLPCQSE
jgi:intein/homing endonuclease